MMSHRWKSPLEQAGLLRRITTRWLRGEGLPPDLYLPGDTVIVEPRRAIRPGEIVVAETVGGSGVREAIYFHAPGSAVIRFVPPGGPAGGPAGGPERSEGRQALTRSEGRQALTRSEGRQDPMGSGAVSLQVPGSDLAIIGIVIGLRRAL